MTPRRRSTRRERRTDDQVQELAVPARWERQADDLIKFANQIFVRLQEDHTVLTFGQAEVPYEAPLTEETRNKLQEEGLPIQVVTRLAVTPQRLGNMADQMKRIYDIWLASQQGGAGDDSTQSIGNRDE